LARNGGEPVGVVMIRILAVGEALVEEVHRQDRIELSCWFPKESVMSRVGVTGL